MKNGIFILLLAALALPALAGPDQASPAAKAKFAPAKVTVVSVSGPAQKTLTAGEKTEWTAIKASDVLDELTVIRTGFGAKVVLRFDDRGEVTVHSATKMGIAEFRKAGRQAKVRLGLKYGTMRASVETGAGPSDFKVATPVATLSVRGSKSKFSFTGDMGLGLKGQAGEWNVASAAQGQNIKPGENTQVADGKIADSINLAMRRRDTQMGDAFGAQTAPDRINLRKNRTGRGIFGFGGIIFRNLRLLAIPSQLKPSYRSHQYE